MLAAELTHEQGPHAAPVKDTENLQVGRKRKFHFRPKPKLRPESGLRHSAETETESE